MPDGVHQQEPSHRHACTASEIVGETATIRQANTSLPAVKDSNRPSLKPHQAGSDRETAGAVAGEKVAHFQNKDTIFASSSGRGQNKSSAGSNNNEDMKCLSALECSMKANERYVLLNKNTFQEIFDATLHEMTGATTPVLRQVDINAEPMEGLDSDSVSLRSANAGHQQHHNPQHPLYKEWLPESSGLSTKKSSNNNESGKKNDISPSHCSSDRDQAAQLKINSGTGILCTEPARIEKASQGIFTSRVSALSDITNDHIEGFTVNNRSDPIANQSNTAVSFLPPMSPMGMENENEPLDLTMCRRVSKSSSTDGVKSPCSTEGSSTQGSPISIVSTDTHPHSKEGQQHCYTTVSNSESNDKDSLSDTDDEDDEEIDLVGCCNSSGNGEGNKDGSTCSTSATRPTGVCKHSTSDEGLAACWQPTSNVPSEPSCHQPRGAGATTKQARSIDNEIPVDHTTCTGPSTNATTEQRSSVSRSSDSNRTMTGGSGGMATSKMKPRATENWAALSKATVYELVEEMVLKMDEEESEASRSPPLSNSSTNSSISNKSMTDKSGGSGSVEQEKKENVPSPSTALPEDKQHGKPSYSSKDSTFSPIKQNYDQSLSPTSKLSTSQQSPKLASTQQQQLPYLFKPGKADCPRGMVGQAEEKAMSSGAQTERHSSENVKQCWVALNKMVVFDIVETAIRSETKEQNNNANDDKEGSDRDFSQSSPSGASSGNGSRHDGDKSYKSKPRNVLSGCNSAETISRKRKCDSSSPQCLSASKTSKYVKQMSNEFPQSFERVLVNDCKVPKRPRSSECASGHINAEVLPTKQRRKSAEINRNISTGTCFEGIRQTDNRLSDEGYNKKEDNRGRQSVGTGTATPAKEWVPPNPGRLPSGRMSPYYLPTSVAATAGQTSGRAGKTIKPRGSLSPRDGGKRKSPTFLSGSSPVHDSPRNNVSSITQLVQSQRTTIDYGRSSNEIHGNSTIKRSLHSSTSQAQAQAATRSRSDVSVNNQYALNDTRGNNDDGESRRKRSGFYSPAGGSDSNTRSGLDVSRAVTIHTLNERGDFASKDARSSPRLGWIAVSKADVHSLFDSVVDSMMAAEDDTANVSQEGRDANKTSRSATTTSATTPAASATTATAAVKHSKSAAAATAVASTTPRDHHPSSPSGSTSSAESSNSTGSPLSDPENAESSGSRSTDNGPCLLPSALNKTRQAESPSASSDILDSEHMILDPGSADDMYLDAEGKDPKHKAFKWKSSLLMRVHEESQSIPLAYDKKQIGSNRSSSNSSPCSESGSEKCEKGLGQSSSTSTYIKEGGQGRHHNISSRSSRKSGKKGISHSHARAK